MRQGTPGFIGARLREAREARSLTQAELAEKLDVTTQAISQYERGSTTPHPDVTARLPEILVMPAAHFFEPLRAYEAEGTVFWRSLSASTATARTRAEHRLGWLKRVMELVSGFITLPVARIPNLGTGVEPEDITAEDIEKAAASLRSHWGLGQGPISNVVYLLENHGAVTTRLELGAATLDAFSEWSAYFERPFIVLGADKASAARSRWDAAHELAHMVLHRQVKDSALRKRRDFQLMESQAHHFAGAFLLPAEPFADDLLTLSLDSMLALKSKWNVSMAAMMMRAKTLGMVREEDEKRFWRGFARRGYRKSEPLDDTVVPERPALVAESLRLILQEGLYTPMSITSALSLGGAEVEEVSMLPPGSLDPAPRPRLKTFRTGKRLPGESPSVLHFPKNRMFS
jgi:Zn-dependent peptidase ImmA (M78 family)/transcriptional regulator with XRE-family HTH domain